MVFAFAALVLTPPTFCPPESWAFFSSPGLTVSADLDGDGFGDLAYIPTSGAARIDYVLNRTGMKAAPIGSGAVLGKDVQAAACGEFDEVPGTDIAYLLGEKIYLASLRGKSFHVTPDWATLPKKVATPRMAVLDDRLLVWNESSGRGYAFDPKERVVRDFRGPVRLRSLQQVVARNGRAVLFSFADGRVSLADTAQAKPGPMIGKCLPGRQPAIANAWIFVDQPAVNAPTFVKKSPENPTCSDQDLWLSGDWDKDGDTDLVQIYNGTEQHRRGSVYLHRFVSRNETDSDKDGLSGEEEKRLGTDPFRSDTDNDGLLDGWEVGGFRGLDLKGLGCSPTRPDVICLLSRFSNAKKEVCEKAIEMAKGYYQTLGWGLHTIWLDEVKEEDQKRPWWELRDKFIPSKWRGVVHWMQLTPWGGGQADQLGDGGGCGGGNEWALYATFVHEFGHQLGLSHEGFYGAAWCPTYPSMMNYAYSYGYEDDIKKIRYSNGSLANFLMRETDLDESLPLPISQVGFLAKGPYRYRLKENGDTTLIDWNWNGVFGEKHVRADVNYSYSTTAGFRNELGKAMSAPWLFTHGKDAYVLVAQHGQKGDVKTDPTVSREKPGWLVMRRLRKPYESEKPVKIVESGVTGDPVAASFGGSAFIAYAGAGGIVVLRGNPSGAGFHGKQVFANAEAAQPSLVTFSGKLWLLTWDPETKLVTYRKWTGSTFGNPKQLPGLLSTVPVGGAEDTLNKELVLGLAQDQDEKRPSRWQIRRFKLERDELREVSSEWIEGEAGQARGRSRPVVLYDAKGITGMKGRILFFGLGMTSKETPWSCAYVAQSVGDKTVGNGWMVKRFYDEWTQSRSAPAAAWFDGDIVYAYRWVDGSQNDRDNLLHVAFNGTGIENTPMGDFDDIGFIAGFGMRHSILYLRE